MIAPVYEAPTDVAGYDPYRDSDGCWFDANEAVRRIKFFETGLSHTKGHLKGKPFKLEPWEKDIIATLFGWKREDGTRRYRECFIFIPRKNGKSTIAAGITLCVLYQDGEGAAECYCVAGDLDQTDMVYGTAAEMVRQSKMLASLSKVRDARKRIIYGSSFLRAIPADAKGAHGFNLHFVCGDELHTWPGRDLKDTLHTGTGFRQQPLEVYITTAGFELLSIAGETYTHACKVRDGQIKDPAFLPVVYEALKTDDWKEEKTWAKANPNYGISVKKDYIASECKKAIENPAYENTFKRLHLNMWTEQKTRWIPLDTWNACQTTKEPIAEQTVVFGGLDLSSKTDITAWCIGKKVGAGYKCQWKFYIPEDRARLIEDRDRVPYSQWIRDGYVIATPGRVIDYSFVEADIIKDSLRYDLRYLGYDPWNAEGTRQRLEYEGLKCVEVRQGFASLSGPCKDIERAVIAGLLDHGKNPVMDWMISNVEVQTDVNGNIRPVRPEHNAGPKKIDGVLALVMMVAVALSHDEAESVYNTPGAMLL